EIARRCQVSQSFVSRLRSSASDAEDQMRPRKVRRGERVYEMVPRTRGDQKPPPELPAKTPDGPMTSAPGTDRVGLQLPANSIPAFADLSIFATAEKLCDQLTDVVDQLAQSPGGAAYLPQLVGKTKDGKLMFVSPELNVFRQKLGLAAPHC